MLCNVIYEKKVKTSRYRISDREGSTIIKTINIDNDIINKTGVAE